MEPTFADKNALDPTVDVLHQRVVPSQRRRIHWIDIARGIGIILVVYGHVLRGIYQSGMISMSSPVWISDYAIYTFHMPLFFLLAGLQVEHSLGKGNWPFLKSKLQTIAYPYFLWAVVQGSLQIVMPQLSNAERNGFALVGLIWRPIAQFWFLYMLFLCHLAGLVTQAQKKIVLAVMCVCLAFCLFHPYPTGIFDSFPHWFFFYGLGILLSPWLLHWKPTLSFSSGWLAASVVVYSLAEHFGRTLSHNHPDAPASWTAGIAGIVVVICLSQIIESVKGWFVPYAISLGQASMTIYIFHVIVDAAARALLKTVHITEWQPQLITGTLLGVSIPWILHIQLEKHNLLAPLGLGARKRFVAKSA